MTRASDLIPQPPPLAGSTALGAAVTGQGQADQVGRWLRRQIIDGQWPVNSRIPTEQELTHHLGVGPGHVRAAVRALTHVGMLETARGRGTWVRATSPIQRVLTLYLQELEPGEIVQVRRAMEIEAAALAAERRTAADITALQASIEADEGRPSDGEFHLVIMRTAGCQLLTDIHSGLDGAVRANLRRRLRRRVVSPQVIAREHRAILTAIVASDPGRARAVFADHAACGYLPDAP